MHTKSTRSLMRQAKLSAAEKKLLGRLVRHTAGGMAPLQDEAALGTFFSDGYAALRAGGAAEEDVAALFSARFKLEKAREAARFRDFVRALDAGQDCTYKDADGTDWSLRLHKAARHGMAFSLPRELAASGKRPAERSRCLLTFSTDGGACTVQFRVRGYEDAADGQHFLHTSEADRSRPILRRRARRQDVRLPCSFSALKTAPGKEPQAYELSYAGELQDVSATGCCMRCQVAIPQGQPLLLQFSLDGTEKLSAAGAIVMTKKSSDGREFALHIQFTDIALAAQNTISAFIYGYTTA